MANTLFSVLRKSLPFSLIRRVNNIGLASVYGQDVKYLFSKAALGIDGFEQQREKVKSQMLNITDKFKEKMTEYASSESKNMVFTEDLKNMIHLAENDKDIEVAIEMLKRYNKQNKSLRFGNYVFGPVVMRMLHIHNKADLALECFKSEELTGLFDQHGSYQILMDLLYENKKYKEMLEAFELITSKQLDGHKYPKNVVVLVLAACYKINNQESLEYALKLWSELNSVGHLPVRKAVTFAAGLALNQGKPEISLELLANQKSQSYTTVRNIKVAALAEVARVEDVIPILKGVLHEDVPQTQKHTFNRDVLERVKQAILKSDNPELALEFNRIHQIFEKNEHVTEATLDEQLCAEIQRPNLNRQQNFQPREYNQYNSNRRFQNRPGTERYSQRPGLAELV